MGPTENCGDAFTSWILPDGGDRLISRSVVRSASNFDENGASAQVNLRVLLEPSSSELEGSTKDRFTALSDEISELEGKKMGIMLDPEELLGYTFARERDGVHQRATVKDVDVENKFIKLEYLTGQTELIEYNELINIINANQEDGDVNWSFKDIQGHRKRSKKWEVLVNWDHCNATWEPLTEIRLADSTS